MTASQEKRLLQALHARTRKTLLFREASAIIEEIAKERALSISNDLIEAATRDARTIFELTKENAMLNQHVYGKKAA